MVGFNSAMVQMTGSAIPTVVSGTTVSNVTFANGSATPCMISGSVDSSSPTKDAENFIVIIPASGTVVWPEPFNSGYGILMDGPATAWVSWRYHGQTS